MTKPSHPLARDNASAGAAIGRLSARHKEFKGPPLRIALTGASGLVGGALTQFLTAGGHGVFPLVRRAPRPGSHEISWHPSEGLVDRDQLESMNAVVHLAGENIAAGRWNPARKQAIRASREAGTRTLCEALAGLEAPPKVLVSASAVGIYGDRGEEPLTEDSPPGAGFLADVCQAWEAATTPAEQAGIRVVRLRICMVLTRQGGSLAKLLLPFRLGLGGRVGDGQQVMSWIHLDDLLAAILFCLRREDIRGAVNAVAPEPITNQVFTKTLAGVLRRPAFLPVPGLVARLALGEMARELLLSGQRVLPRALTTAGFRFDYPTLVSGLEDLLQKGNTGSN